MFAVNGSIRLVGGATANKGRVEIYLNGVWGTVCDDTWDILDAIVACRQLGYSSALSANGSAYFGAGTGAIHYDNVVCIGNEARLADCSHGDTEACLDGCSGSGIGMHYCVHSKDAGVVCDTRPSKLGS